MLIIIHYSFLNRSINIVMDCSYKVNQMGFKSLFRRHIIFVCLHLFPVCKWFHVALVSYIDIIESRKRKTIMPLLLKKTFSMMCRCSYGMRKKKPKIIILNMHPKQQQERKRKWRFWLFLLVKNKGKHNFITHPLVSFSLFLGLFGTDIIFFLFR